MKPASLPDRFSALEDPRQSWETVCLSPKIRPLVLCAACAHRGIETRWHMVVDIAFRNDLLRLRHGEGGMT